MHTMRTYYNRNSYITSITQKVKKLRKTYKNTVS